LIFPLNIGIFNSYVSLPVVRFWFYFYFAWLKSEKRSIVTSAISWKPVTGGKLREVLRSHRQGQAESLTGALVKLGRAGPFF
jgi:hypothetical protein